MKIIQRCAKSYAVFSLLAVCALCRADEWIPAYRTALVIDACQTWSIRGSKGAWEELNPLYRDMGTGEAALSVLAVGYLVERAIVAIPDRKLRNVLGYLAVALESGTVGRNMGLGIRIRF